MRGLTHSGKEAAGGAPQHGSSAPGRAETRGNGRSNGHGAHGDIARLLAAVEREVIPRLVREHAPRRPVRHKPSLTEVERLAGLAIDGMTGDAAALVDELRAAGVSLTSVYIDLLAATARLLGEMWEQDRVSFLDVTVGLCTLHQVLFRLGPDLPEEPSGGAGTGRVLLAPVPGETHVFGALIVARFFARAGWRTWTELDADEARLSGLIAEHGFDVVGLSLSCDREAEELRGMIGRLRDAAGPRRPQIFVGGHAIERRPDLVEAIGADATSPDPVEAVAIASAGLGRREGLD